MEEFSVGSLDSIFYVPSFLSGLEQDYFLGQVESCMRRVLLPNLVVPQWLRSLTQRISTETGLFPSPINHVLVNEYAPGQGIMPHQDGPLYFPVVAIVSLGSPTLMRFSPHPRILEAASLNWADQEVLATTHGLDGAEHAYDKPMIRQGSDLHKVEEGYGKKLCFEQPNDSIPKDISVIMIPGSLLVFKDSAYQEYLHGIEDSIEHKLDKTVVNGSIVKSGQYGRSQHTWTEEGLLSGLDLPQPSTLLRTGTRISLTCRLVSKVQGKFLRL